MDKLPIGVPFDLRHEACTRSEKLAISFDECLFYGTNGRCACGSCGAEANLAARPTSCGNQSCLQQWRYLIVEPRAPEINDPWLPIYGKSSVIDNTRDKDMLRRTNQIINRTLGLKSLE